MKRIIIDADEWIADMEDGKYRRNNSEYAKGCNDVLDYYIKKLKRMIEEAKKNMK